MSLQNINTNNTKIGSQSVDELKKKNDAKLKKVCADFEAIFVAQMLKSMRESVEKSDLFGDGFGSDMYQSMFDTQLSEKIAQGSGTGIGQILYKTMAARLNGETAEADISGPISLQDLFEQRPDTSSASLLKKIQNYDSIIQEAATKYQVPSHLVYGIIAQESGGDPDVVSRAGAKGLMQLMDSTAADLGVENSFDPGENIDGGVRYLREQLDAHKNDVTLALAAYNAGPASVDKYNGVPPFRETQDYVKKVLYFANKFSKQLGQEDDNI
jgi:Rod binding domain-containing protein